MVSSKRTTDMTAGIAIVDQGRHLPAKEVLPGTAYRLANRKLPSDSNIKFSSGEWNSLNVLQKTSALKRKTNREKVGNTERANEKSRYRAGERLYFLIRDEILDVDWQRIDAMGQYWVAI